MRVAGFIVWGVWDMQVWRTSIPAEQKKRACPGTRCNKKRASRVLPPPCPPLDCACPAPRRVAHPQQKRGPCPVGFRMPGVQTGAPDKDKNAPSKRQLRPSPRPICFPRPAPGQGRTRPPASKKSIAPHTHSKRRPPSATNTVHAPPPPPPLDSPAERGAVFWIICCLYLFFLSGRRRGGENPREKGEKERKTQDKERNHNQGERERGRERVSESKEKKTHGSKERKYKRRKKEQLQNELKMYMDASRTRDTCRHCVCKWRLPPGFLLKPCKLAFKTSRLQEDL